MLKQKKITMIMCLLMLIVISGCESSKKRNVPDTNQRNQEETIDNSNTQYPTIDPATLAAFKGFNSYATNIASTEKECIELSTRLQNENEDEKFKTTENNIWTFEGHIIADKDGKHLTTTDLENVIQNARNQNDRITLYNEDAKFSDLYYIDSESEGMHPLTDILKIATFCENKTTKTTDTSIYIPNIDKAITINRISHQFKNPTSFEYSYEPEGEDESDDGLNVTLFLTNPSLIEVPNKPVDFTNSLYSRIGENINDQWVNHFFIAKDFSTNTHNLPTHDIKMQHNAYVTITQKDSESQIIITFNIIDENGDKQTYKTEAIDLNLDAYFELSNHSNTHIGYIKPSLQSITTKNKILMIEFYDTEKNLFKLTKVSSAETIFLRLSVYQK